MQPDPEHRHAPTCGKDRTEQRHRADEQTATTAPAVTPARAGRAPARAPSRPRPRSVPAPRRGCARSAHRGAGRAPPVRAAGDPIIARPRLRFGSRTSRSRSSRACRRLTGSSTAGEAPLARSRTSTAPSLVRIPVTSRNATRYERWTRRKPASASGFRACSTGCAPGGSRRGVQPGVVALRLHPADAVPGHQVGDTAEFGRDHVGSVLGRSRCRPARLRRAAITRRTASSSRSSRMGLSR